MKVSLTTAKKNPLCLVRSTTTTTTISTRKHRSYHGFRRHARVVAVVVCMGILFVVMWQRVLLIHSTNTNTSMTRDELLWIADVQGEIKVDKREYVWPWMVASNDESSKPRTTTMTTFHGVAPRTFGPWPREQPLPCWDPWDDVVDTNNNQPNWFDRSVQKRPTAEGLLFLKLCKTASSTAASVHLRLARNLAIRRRQQHDQTLTNQAPWPVCRSRFLHGWAGPRMYKYGQRNRTASFLWTTLRQPTQRYISDYFHFEVSRKNVTVNLRTFVRYLRKGPHSDHHSLSWLAVHGYRYGMSDPIRTANSILRDYDFIGLAERFDESVVVLSMLLGLPLRDVLYLSSKQSGGYDGLCFQIRQPQVTESMQRHLQTAEWQTYIAPEVALWRATNTSLDLTIDQLGRTRVEKQVRLFQTVVQAVQETCRSITKFPCTATGETIPANETDCLVVDMGCGLECIDRVADDFNLPTT